MKAVLVGGTGLVGSRLTEELRRRGVEVVVVSRDTGVDVLTGAGLADALVGADVVVDTLNTATMDADVATRFFTAAAEQLSTAERAAGIRRHVLLSIVGLEHAQANGYYVGKLAQEKAVREGGVPFTILRSTQFFEFVPTLADWATADGVVTLAPRSMQPVAVDDMVAVLADVVQAEPIDGTVEVAGPDTVPVAELVRAALTASGDTRSVVEAPEGQTFGASTTNSLVPQGEYRQTIGRYRDWLSTDG